MYYFSSISNFWLMWVGLGLYLGSKRIVFWEVQDNKTSLVEFGSTLGLTWKTFSRFGRVIQHSNNPSSYFVEIIYQIPSIFNVLNLLTIPYHSWNNFSQQLLNLFLCYFTGITASDICNKHCNSNDLDIKEFPETREELKNICK